MDYSRIVNVFIAELESPKLYELDTNFYKQALDYVKRLEAKDGNKYEAKVLRRTLEKLFILRLEKIIKHIWRTGEKPNIKLPMEEAVLLNEIERIVSTIRGKEEGIEEIKHISMSKEIKGVLVYFTKPYSRIMLKEGVILGPFSQGDIAFLPREIAKELESKGVIKIM